MQFSPRPAVRGRVWLLLGAAVGVGIGIGAVPYLAGAAHALADTSERLVGSAGHRLIHAAAASGAPRRLVLGITAVCAVLVPGAASLALVIAARSTLRIRALVALATVAIGAASFAYQPSGVASGVLVLALAVSAMAVAASGPLVAAPLAGLAGLMGAEYLPNLATGQRAVTAASVNDLHSALFGSPGTPLVLRVVLLVVAAVPFAAAARLLLRK